MIDLTSDMRYSARDAKEVLLHAWRQQHESGHDVAELEPAVRDVVAGSSPLVLEDRLFDLLEEAPMRSGHKDEDDLFPQGDLTIPPPDDLADRLRGAWFGRCAGCLLGKPVEGWSHEDIEAYLSRAGITDVLGYLPRLASAPGQPEFNAVGAHGTFSGEINGMARDDDIDYTIAALLLAERHGTSFGPSDVADLWLEIFPYHQVFTAERVAMRNLLRGHAGVSVATWRNPYREWIGALIRADFWGYISPGRPWRAAELVEKDARLSHTANGVGGARWAAALVATALAVKDVRDVVEIARTVLADGSRLAVALDAVTAWREQGCSFTEVLGHIVKNYGDLSPVHTINNAALIQAALLWGEGDFTRSIGLVVRSGWDTDSNGATVGSVVGALNGFSGIDDGWTLPLGSHTKTAIVIEPALTIDILVARTMALLDI